MVVGVVRTRGAAILILLILLAGVIASTPARAAERTVDTDRVMKHLEAFSSFSPRISGYEGAEKAAQYIADQLRSYGYDVRLEEYNVTVPVDYGAKLYLETSKGSYELKAYALAPNVVETCATEGLKGEIVYVETKYSDLRDFEGLDVKDKIVALDYDSEKAWRWAAYLGAKAVIFLIDEDAHFTYLDNFWKRFWVPIDFPRIAVRTSDFMSVYENGAKGKIVIKMKYEVRKAYNVVAVAEGDSDTIVMLTTHYDTWSVIPSLAEGADDALSAAVLLDIARLVYGRHKYTLMVTFFSGYHQALQGAREFAYAHKKDILPKLGLVLEIQISSSSKEVGIYDRGNFHAYYPVSYQNSIFPLKEKARKLLEDRGVRVVLWEYSPTEAPIDRPRYFNFEIFSMLNIPSMALGSYLWESRATPADTYDKLLSSPETKPREVAKLFGDAYLALADLFLDYSESLLHFFREGNLRSFKGKVVYFDASEGVYKPLGDSLVLMFGRSTVRGVWVAARHYVITKTDKNGRFIVRTVVTSDYGSYEIFAFQDEPPEGPIKYAPDFGVYARMAFNVRAFKEVNDIEVSVFNAGSVVFFDVMDPDTASPVSEFIPVLVIDHHTQNYARYFSFTWEWVGFAPSREMSTGTLVVYENPRLAQTPTFDAVVELGGTRWFAAIFNNRGKGYVVEPGQQIIVPFTIKEAFLGFRLVDEERVKAAKSSRLFVEPIEYTMSEAKEEWERAEEYLKEKKWYEARGSYVLAWMLERKAYVNLRNFIFDASYASVFFLLLALPFAYLLERLVFEFEDVRRRVMAFVGLFIAVVIFMLFEHPGFTLIASLPLVAIAFLMLVLTLVPMIITTNHAIEAIKELRTRFIGKHFAELDKLSAMVLAASLGLRNLRRRWLRTTLLIVSIIIATMAFVSIVSVLSTRYVAPVATFEVDRGYEGLLIRQRGFRPLPSFLSKQIASAFPQDVEYVSEVIFYYPFGQNIEIARTKKGEPITIDAVLGLDPKDFEVIPALREDFEALFVEGSRPFESRDELVCILPIQLVEQLSNAGIDVKIGSTIEVLNRKLEVVGILNNTKAYLSNVRDLDGLALLPFERGEEAGGRLTVRSANPMDPSVVIIVPSNIAKRMGGQVYAIRIIPKDPSKSERIARKMAELFEYHVYYSQKKDGKYEVIRVASVTAQQVTGQEAIIPEILLMFTILSSILGAVYERTREIGILSAVGLSPLHVAGIFLMEFTIVAVVSAFLGYMMGITMPALVSGLKVNAGSMWIVFSVLASMGVTLAATAYPVRYASRLVTPSFERKWKLETHAVRRGDTFIVKIPFVISRAEVKGALYYLKEYLSLFRSEETPAPFVIDSMEYKEERVEGRLVRILDMKVRVKPLDWGVSMISQLKVETVGKTTAWTLVFERLSGTEHVWVRGVREMTDTIRKQLLMWRGLPPADREEYIKKAREE